MCKILVTGGAGYIGSQMVDMLRRANKTVLVLDNLSTGYKDAVLDAELVVADLADEISLEALFRNNHFDAVMHFAGFIKVAESVQNPAKYYRNNLINSINLLDIMVKHDVRNIVFSSSAAVYGEPQYTPIDTKHATNPLNPYGFSKLALEKVLKDYDYAYGLKSISFRYFNAAGADIETRLGERHDPETHLIPLVLQVASGRTQSIRVFGDDYATRDGTCIRDYIHVVDICEAHLLALEALLHGGESQVFNLGNGCGYSVLEVIKTAEEVTGRKIKIENYPRRPGDPAILIADAKLAKKKLAWEAKFSDLKTILNHAWLWEQKLFGQK